VGTRPIRAAGLALLSTASLACAPTHEKLWRELDQLEMPEGYELIHEEAAGVYPPFFGDTLRVRRRYRSPHDMSHTCEDVRRVAEGFSTGGTSFYPEQRGRFRSVCSASFVRRGFAGGFNVQSPMDPDYARKLGREPGTDVIVDATLKAP